MYSVYLDWPDFKSQLILKNFTYYYRKISNGYEVFCNESDIVWTSNLIEEAHKTDFESNYLSGANKSLYADDGKKIVRSESRPLGTTTCFVGRADSATAIGEGKALTWDFSNDEDLLEIESGAGTKTKRIEFRFLDSVWIKEGALYYHNAPKGCHLDMYVVCPAGGYYLDNSGNIQMAFEDTPVSHYVISHFLQGTVPMGDELNTESCSDEVPNYYKFWIEITTPVEDNTSNGFVEVELYRKRTTVL